MFDCHIHCCHSDDTTTPIERMVKTAIKHGMKYISFSDHLNRDFMKLKSFDPSTDIQLDIPFHIADVARVKKEYEGQIDIACGVECGFSKESESDYVHLLSGQDFDVILNSIHTADGYDCYKNEYYEGKSKAQAYEQYLLAVLDSVNCAYDFDIVAHIGYICRKAPYEDKDLNFLDFPDIFNSILKGIIKRGVSLEINSHNRGTNTPFLPFISVIDRYIELGGSDFTFGSDAHRIDRVGDKFDVVKDFLLAKNQRYINIYKNRQKIKIDLTKI